MLKLILAQLGLSITQEQVETALREAKNAYDAVQDMKASQLRCEAMLIDLRTYFEEDRNAPLQNISVKEHVTLGKEP